MSATFLNSVFHAIGSGLPFRRRGRAGAAIDLSRLSAYDLADLNLPADVRARIDMGRDLRYWDSAQRWLRV